jgi:23S rRNA (guanosine2251-2'-O)-methyltransferase
MERNPFQKRPTFGPRTSAPNPFRPRRENNGSGADMIFGLRAVIEAIEAGKEIDKILIRNELTSDLAKELFAGLQGRNIPVQRVPVDKLNGITQKNHQGVIAFMAAIEYQQITNIIPELYEQAKTPFIVVLDGVTDVRNFGAIVRTCECAGVNAIVVPSRGSAAANADAMKTSAGALNVMPVCRENSLIETIKFLKSSGLKIVAATEKAAKNYTEISFQEPVALVMGSEDVGISDEVLRLCDELIAIPILGTIASLNVSVATGVLAYEVIRQRK